MIKLKYRTESFKMNEIIVKPTMFPDGTSQVYHIPIWTDDENYILNHTEVEITWHFENEAELIHVGQLNDLLKHNGHRTKLLMPYLPYARQDKEVTNETTFGLYTFNKLLKAIQFDTVKAFDIHNTEFTHVENMIPYNLLTTVAERTPEFLFFPDRQAYSRYKTMFEDMGLEHCLFNKLPHIVGNKFRNPSTGEIVEYKLSPRQPQEFDIEGKKCLVIDDILDGGSTFTKAYDLLKSLNVSTIELYVSHVVQQSSVNRLIEHGYASIHYYESLAK
jgi:ribose-phosphate pyrophosphokinase